MALLSCRARAGPVRSKRWSGEDTLPQLQIRNLPAHSGHRRNGVHVERCRCCFALAGFAIGLVASRRIHPAGSTEFGGLAEFAISDVDEIPAALVLLRRRSSPGLDQRHFGLYHRPLLRGHLRNADLADSPRWTRSAVPPL